MDFGSQGFNNKLILLIFSAFFLTFCIQISLVSAESSSAEIYKFELAQSSEPVESVDKEDIAELISEEKLLYR